MKMYLQDEDSEETKLILHQEQQTNHTSLHNSIRRIDKDALIEELRKEIDRLNTIVENTKVVDQKVDNIYSDGPVMLAVRRIPALFVTLFIELFGGLIIANLNTVIKKYTLLVSFMPAISALSGNFIIIGLYK